MLPSIWNENLWDEWFGFPELRDMDRAERKLYGRHADRLMKTDVREHEDQYEVDIDLPGFVRGRYRPAGLCEGRDQAGAEQRLPHD